MKKTKLEKIIYIFLWILSAVLILLFVLYLFIESSTTTEQRIVGVTIAFCFAIMHPKFMGLLESYIYKETNLKEYEK